MYRAIKNEYPYKCQHVVYASKSYNKEEENEFSNFTGFNKRDETFEFKFYMLHGICNKCRLI